MSVSHSSYAPPVNRNGFTVKLNDLSSPSSPDFAVGHSFWLWRHRPVRSVAYTLLGFGLAFVILKQSYLDSAGRDHISKLVQQQVHKDSTAHVSLPSNASAPDSCSCPLVCEPTATVPLHFQTTPQVFAGPTATGEAPFLAQTVAFDPSGAMYEPNAPLQTAIPVANTPAGANTPNIFRLMGNLSPYVPSTGFGVNEYPLPQGARLLQLQMMSRHGSRYPTTGSHVAVFGERMANASGKFTAKDELAFLNDWKYKLGAEILVPKGRQELYDSGVLHAYMYGQLYNTHSKIIARTTTQDRMLKSAENFMAGFFGLEWTNNATLELIIEETGFNNSLAGYMNCPNANEESGGKRARSAWVNVYLQNATARLKPMIDGYDWTIEDTYAAQTLCPYETVAYGYSVFCNLFTYQEWEGFSYSLDLDFSASSGFQSPTGRAVGIGYQQEVIARLQNHTLGYSGSQINTTLDDNTDTFPLNQSLYLDFSHDSNIISVLAAFGLRQFADPLSPTANPGPHNFTVTNLTPFGARLDIELIETPKPLSADRSGYLNGPATKYIHFVLNQRTVPLGVSFEACDVNRVDGWCELDTFLKVQSTMPEKAAYPESCHGKVEGEQFGKVTDGVPVPAGSL